MKKKRKFTKKKIFLLIAIALVVILFITNLMKPKEIEEEIETEAIQKRDLAKTISATGVVSTSNTKNVTSKLQGVEIKTINVQEGQKISVGDVICTFDTSSLQENLNIAQNSKDLSTAQSSIAVGTAQRSLDEVKKSKDDTLEGIQKQLNNISINIDNIQKSIPTIQAKIKNAELASNNYQATYITAKTNFDAVENHYNELVRAVEEKKNEIAVDEALAIANGTTPNLELVNGVDGLNKRNADLAQYEITYKTAQETFNPIKAQNETLTKALSDAQTELASANNQIATLKNSYSQLAQNYKETSETFDKQIANVQDQVASAQISTSLGANSAEPQINSLKEQIEEGVIKSTVDGTVTKVNSKVGDIYMGSTIAVIEGCEEFIIETEIDEYDIPDIKEGMKVYIKTDATRNEELEGTVIYTAPSATSIGNSMSSMSTATSSSLGSATYTVKIALNTPNDRLRLGMNAKLSIILDSRENVWTVPYDAVYSRDDGTHYIEILKDPDTEEKQEINVEKGLEGTYYVEIISNELNDQMKVILPKLEEGNSLEDLIEMMGANAGM